MPTTTIIILICAGALLTWTVFQLLKDLFRKIAKPAEIRGRSEEIRQSIEVEREKDRVRMGSMFASSVQKDTSR